MASESHSTRVGRDHHSFNNHDTVIVKATGETGVVKCWSKVHNKFVVVVGDRERRLSPAQLVMPLTPGPDAGFEASGI